MVVGVTTATPRGANVELQLSREGGRHFGGLEEEHWSRFGREIIFKNSLQSFVERIS